MTSFLPRILSFLRPLLILSLSSAFAAVTAAKLIVSLDIATLLSPSAFQQQWFATFWTAFGPISAAANSNDTKRILAAAYGRVIDLGPGSGLTVGQLDVTKVSHVLGVEPCVHLHDALRENVRLAGLADVYEVSGLGAEQLQLEPESVDTVVCCKVLCGVPEPEKVLAQLYRVLKPGGQFLVFEHVANRRSWVAGAWQGALQILWPHFTGGCNINRRTQDMLRACGKWEVVELAAPSGEQAWEVIPHVQGRLVKPGTPELLPPLRLGDALDLFGDDLSSATVWYLVISYCFWGFFAAVFA